MATLKNPDSPCSSLSWWIDNQYVTFRKPQSLVSACRVLNVSSSTSVCRALDPSWSHMTSLVHTGMCILLVNTSKHDISYHDDYNTHSIARGIVIRKSPRTRPGHRRYLTVAFRNGRVERVPYNVCRRGRFITAEEFNKRNVDLPTTTIPVPTTPDTETECSICYENYNDRLRTPVVCPACEQSACKTCVRRYVISDNTRMAQCPHCNIALSRPYMITHLGRHFVTSVYRRHRKQLLLEAERARVPEVMRFVPTYRTLQQAKHNAQILRRALRVTYQQYYVCRNANQANPTLELEHNLETLLQQLNDTKTESNQAIRFLWQIRREYRRLLHPTTDATEQRRVFRHRCPAHDCKGFLTSSWKCPVCENWTCRTCLCLRGNTRDAPHVCDPEAVQSTALIRKETRNCPGCAARIYKIDGCDQMFCTQCHIGFSWRTGRRVHGRLHNPHFFQWRRDMERRADIPRPMPHNPCNAEDHVPNIEIIEITIRSAHHSFQKYNDATSDTMCSRDVTKVMDQFRNLYTAFIHFRYNIVDPMRERNEDNNDAAVKSRIQYAINEMTDTRFATLLLRRDNQHAVRTEILRALELVVTIIMDEMRGLVRAPHNTIYDLFKCIIHIQQVLAFANTQLKHTSNCFGNCVVTMFGTKYDNGERFSLRHLVRRRGRR